jgi:hypothetical protein
MKKMKIAKTLVITIFLLVFVIFCTGGGHGTYIPAQIIYPYTMIIAKLQFEIGYFGFFLVLIEIPIYAYFFFNKPNWKFLLLGIHIVAVLISFLIKSDVFN